MSPFTFPLDLLEYSEKWANAGKVVIVSALDGTFQRKVREGHECLRELSFVVFTSMSPVTHLPFPSFRVQVFLTRKSSLSSDKCTRSDINPELWFAQS